VYGKFFHDLPVRFRLLFAAGARDYLAGALDILADAGNSVAASQNECAEGESEYFFHHFSCFICCFI
jgi:hypothetical protein